VMVQAYGISQGGGSSLSSYAPRKILQWMVGPSTIRLSDTS